MNTKITANLETTGITAYFGQNTENAAYGYVYVCVYMYYHMGGPIQTQNHKNRV